MIHIFALVLAVLFLPACKDTPHEPEAIAPKVTGEKIAFPAGSRQASSLVLGQVKAAAPVLATLTGRLVWDEDHTARLYPAFAGRVTKMLVEPGDTVKAGQALALLGSPDFGQAQSDASRSNADFTVAEKNLARARELYEHGVIAQKELQASEADYKKADAERRRTQSRLKLYGGHESVDQQFALATPIGGIVVEKNVNPGQELRPDLISNNGPAMFVVTDPKRLWVKLDASEKETPFVHKGMTVPLKSSAYPGETFTATIDAVSDFVDPTTRTIKVKGTVNNLARKLKGEMFVTAEVQRNVDKALQVPAKAVYLRGDKNYVFVSTGPGEFVRRQVTLGPAQDSTVLVLSGLQEGEAIVASGNLFLEQLLADAFDQASTRHD